MNHRGRSPAHQASTRSQGEETGVADSDSAEPTSKMVYSLTSALAVATADDAFAVAGMLGVPHASFAVSPIHRLDGPVGSDSPHILNSTFCDDTDSADGSYSHDPVVTKKAKERLQQKIDATKEQIRLEQSSRDENVNEFLKLCANADRNQHVRIKQLFEKKNQKSAQTISQLQKKLDEYQKRLKFLDEKGVQIKPTHKMRDKVQGLKNVGGNIRDTVMAKPKEFAYLLRHKFGSADNLTSVEQSEAEPRKSNGASSLPRENSGPRRSLVPTEHHSSIEDYKCMSENGAAVVRRQSADESEKSVDTRFVERLESSKTDLQNVQLNRESSPPNREVMVAIVDKRVTTEWKAVMQELNLHKEEVDRLREEIYEYRQVYKQEIEQLHDQLKEERERFERLEEQMNDLTELHQHEMENINSGVRDMEEKVQYQSEERLIDIKEHLQSLETKLNSLEHQQAQQQYINIEGIDGSDARAILMKLLTGLLTIIPITLFFVGTLLSLARPFFRTKLRFITSFAVILVSVCVYYHEDAIIEVMEETKRKMQRTNFLKA